MFCFTVKVDREKQLIFLEEELEDIDVDELRENLPEHQPRFLVYSFKLDHGDGRFSYPMCFIFSSPRGINDSITISKTKIY